MTTPDPEAAPRGLDPTEVLRRLGPEVAKLLLLQRFTRWDAREYSGDSFDDDRFQLGIGIAFVQDPLTDEYKVRPQLEKALLTELKDLYPHAAGELAEHLLARTVGSEVLDPTDLVRWMVRSRLQHRARVSVACLATFSPYEIEGVSRWLQDSDRSLLLRRMLRPYAQTTLLWVDSVSRTTHDKRPREFIEVLLAESDVRRSSSAYPDGRLPVVHDRRVRGTPAEHGLAVQAKPEDLAQDDEGPDFVVKVRELTAVPADPIRGRRSRREAQHVRVSDSTFALIRLVMANRGPTQTAEKAQIDVGGRSAFREADIGVTTTASVDGRLFTYLGALPSSARLLPSLEIETIGGERLVPGGGPTISLFMREVKVVLLRAGVVDAPGPAVSASDWARLNRAVSEPWRFVSTAREYADMSLITVRWTEPLREWRSTTLPWPFNGAALSECSIEGFRHGTDDEYAMNLSCRDSFITETLEVDAVPRPREAPALERPTRVTAAVQWANRAYAIVLLVAVVVATACLVLGVLGVNGTIDDVGYSDTLVPLSLLSTIVTPAATYVAALASRRDSGPSRYRIVWSRVAGLLLIFLTSIVLSIVSSVEGTAVLLVAVFNLLVGLFLVAGAVLSGYSRYVRPREVLRRIDTALYEAGLDDREG